MVALINVGIGNKRTDTLLDTGAVVSVIDHTFLMQAMPQVTLLKTGKSLRAANKQSMKTYGVAKVPVKIGSLEFVTSFYVCRGISYNVILGNTFLRQSKAILDYGNTQVQFRKRHDRVRFKFGVFYRSIDPVEQENLQNPFANLDVAEVYSGPRFIHSKRKVEIAPRTIQYIRVGISPHIIHEDTVFIGNPHLLKHYNLMVSDLLIKKDGSKYIQITNTGSIERTVTPQMKLAVDDGHESLFYDTVQVSSIKSSSDTTKEKGFNINTKLDPKEFAIANALLEKYRDVGVYMMSRS